MIFVHYFSITKIKNQNLGFYLVCMGIFARDYLVCILLIALGAANNWRRKSRDFQNHLIRTNVVKYTIRPS